MIIAKPMFNSYTLFIIIMHFVSLIQHLDAYIKFKSFKLETQVDLARTKALTRFFKVSYFKQNTDDLLLGALCFKM